MACHLCPLHLSVNCYLAPDYLFGPWMPLVAFWAGLQPSNDSALAVPRSVFGVSLSHHDRGLSLRSVKPEVTQITSTLFLSHFSPSPCGFGIFRLPEDGFVSTSMIVVFLKEVCSFGPQPGMPSGLSFI